MDIDHDDEKIEDYMDLVDVVMDINHDKEMEY